MGGKSDKIWPNKLRMVPNITEWVLEGFEKCSSIWLKGEWVGGGWKMNWGEYRDVRTDLEIENGEKEYK